LRNIKITIEYDGSRYNGWQKQANTENTIQGKLNKILSTICNEDIEIIGSGRTDAGVHANNQIANFKTSSSNSVELLKELANQNLENDICIKEVKEVDQRFHSRYNAVSKKYIYRIWNNKDINVFERKYSYHIIDYLNIEKMKIAANHFIGKHDFKAFTSDKRTKKSTIKTIHTIDILYNNGMLELVFHGNSFLYNMVRIMTGTLIEVGLGRISTDEISIILENKDREKSGYTAPPHGLFLNTVFF
jgi:tRNA pseudouridine38-40 synthase